jgi:hypothetical protein
MGVNLGPGTDPFTASESCGEYPSGAAIWRRSKSRAWRRYPFGRMETDISPFVSAYVDIKSGSELVPGGNRFVSGCIGLAYEDLEAREEEANGIRVL